LKKKIGTKLKQIDICGD